MSLYSQGTESLLRQSPPRSFGLFALGKALETPQTGVESDLGQNKGILAATAVGAVIGGALMFRKCPRVIPVFMASSFGASLAGASTAFTLWYKDQK